MADTLLEEILYIKSDKKALREFGLTVGFILVILGVIMFWRAKSAYIYILFIGIALIAAGLYIPFLLKPVQKIWMAFAALLGFVTSRIVLFIVFYLLVTPIGIFLRLTGKDILDQGIDKARPSYWSAGYDREKTKESYENQY